MKISDIKIAVARKKLHSIAEASSVNQDYCQMAVLLENDDEDSVKSFLQLAEELGLKKEDIKILICKEKGSKKEILEQPIISLNDFSWNGNITGSSSVFLETEYDVLISFTASENKMANFLVSVTRARLKVGRKREDKNGLFDLNISAELSTPEVFTTELRKYLKILKFTA